jgi:serine protease Do
MDQENNTNTTLTTPETPHSEPRRFMASFIVPIVIISLIFGAAGGVFGLALDIKNPAIQKILAAGTIVNQQVSLTESSNIISVVKKASPAVVSIVISQDVSQIPGYGNSPFSNDPFFNFFYNNGGGSQSPQAPPGSGTPDVQQIGAGSGFFISSDGLIVTNKHVVDTTGASYTVITNDGKSYPATVQSLDPVNDLAIVKIDIKNAPYLQLSNSSSLQVGQQVIAIGNSLGQYQNTVTSGIISGIGRKIVAGDEQGSSESLTNVIQTDAAINPGNSGGPLLDVTGNVIGINTAIDQQGQLVGFAIPANEISSDVTSFQQNGKIVKPYLGVRYIVITPDIAQQQNLPESYGALVVSGDTPDDVAVIPGSPADKAGLVENDIILEVNGTKVDENNSLSDLLDNFNPGDTVSLQVYEKGQTKTVQVQLAQAPNNG